MNKGLPISRTVKQPGDHEMSNPLIFGHRVTLRTPQPIENTDAPWFVLALAIALPFVVALIMGIPS